jgi:calcium-dependent protein kinase
METVVGSPYYVAPEVLSNQAYGKECDIWSAGVLLYILLSGRFPFEGSAAHEIFQNVMKGYFDTNFGVWKQISPEAKDLVKSMLIKAPR